MDENSKGLLLSPIPFSVRIRSPDACCASTLTKKILDACGISGQSLERRSVMAQTLSKFPPRSVDNHSFGLNDFEPLLNSHQAAQLLDIHHKTIQKLARRGEIHGPHVGKYVAFSRIWPERMAGSSGTRELSLIRRKQPPKALQELLTGISVTTPKFDHVTLGHRLKGSLHLQSLLDNKLLRGKNRWTRNQQDARQCPLSNASL
jgi:hypothetical protein